MGVCGGFCFDFDFYNFEKTDIDRYWGGEKWLLRTDIERAKCPEMAFNNGFEP